ncbi:LCP family protein [Streptomyces sp. NPDC049906]|uniref:LCP family protein n=1 Tax=Streptomyces sp. NPDC049906 TaxID=3155656 RepID=UPI00342B9895
MNADHRGEQDGFDAADLWVRNPQTGTYELRLDDPTEALPTGPDPAAGGTTVPDPPVPGPRRRAGTPGQRRADGEPAGADTRRSRGSRRSGAAESGSRGASTSTTAAGRRGGRGPRGTTDPAEAGGRRGRRPRASRKRKVLLWTGGVLGVVLVGTSATGYYLYRQLDGNIATVDVGDAGSGKKGLAGRPLNILLLGTDKRTGKGNQGYGDKGSAGHADTTFLFHVSADRSNATALSIPRDLITDIPDCRTKQEDGGFEVIPGTPRTRFNNSYGQQGRDPGCTMRTVTELTGVELDHFMMVDFNAVKALTSALDGVEVCLDRPVADKKAKLELSAGPHTIEGEDALAFVRSRAATKNGSDLDRIEMQQKFVASMIRKAKSDFLDSPTKMYGLASAMTKNLTVDSGIGSIPKLTSLAKELGKVDLKHISFTTIPVKDNPAERVKATVVLDPARAPAVFEAVRNDVSFTEVKKERKADAKKRDDVLTGPRAEPGEIGVNVYNGGELVGAANNTVTWLVDTRGVAGAVNQSNAPAKTATTTLVYAPAQVEQARALADMMGLSAKALEARADHGVAEPMTLTLGADFKGPGVPVTPSSAPPEGVKKVRGDTKMCSS